MESKKDEIKYPIGIQSFQKLREEGYLYVDKTAYIARLKKGNYYFLSRPRRFGKSLLMSTLDAYFRGKRKLFKGLDIDRLTEDWKPHPVFHLDLNNGTYQKEADLDIVLNAHLSNWEKEYGVEIPDTGVSPMLSLRFAELIKAVSLKTDKKVVILVDEYDKPMLNAISNPELMEKFREKLKAFYSNLKTMDQFIEFAMLTGVARFSKISIFSDLNNLRDISFVNEFAGICGITGNELKHYFNEGIQSLAKSQGTDEESVRDSLRKRYDGYHFSTSSPDIYNPFSLINTFANVEFGNYWFDTGTPSYLVMLARESGIPFKEIAPVEEDYDILKAEGMMSGFMTSTFFQTGYLTIKSYDSEYNTVTLDYPNGEVKQEFLKFLLWNTLPDTKNRSEFRVTEFVKAVKVGDIESFLIRFQSLTATIPYQEKLNCEAGFQNLIFLLFTLMGFYVKMEDRMSDGRIDIEIETGNYIYLFEFKIDSSARKALDQILAKKYWLRHNCSEKKIFLIGANFDSKTRTLSEWIADEPRP